MNCLICDKENCQGYKFKHVGNSFIALGNIESIGSIKRFKDQTYKVQYYFDVYLFEVKKENLRTLAFDSLKEAEEEQKLMFVYMVTCRQFKKINGEKYE